LSIKLTVIDLVQERAGLSPDRRAYTFLAGSGDESNVLRCHELETRARAIGALLQETCGNKRSSTSEFPARVLLLYPPGLEFIEAFYGCLFSGCIAVPASPPDPIQLARTLPRFLSILEDSGAAVILTTSQHRAAMNRLLTKDGGENVKHAEKTALEQQVRFFREALEQRGIQWITTDNLTQGLVHRWRHPGSERRTLAFLQYTSGSTAMPKGVMISHGNILHNLEIIHSAARQNQDSCFVNWLPNYHDMGLIGSILYPMHVGFQSVQMSPMSFLKRPLRWLNAITKYRGTITAAPNFAYELCVTRIPPEKREGLDLRTINLALSGSEPVRANAIKRFTEAFAPYGLRLEAILPSYGLAEATCAVSGSRQLTPLVVKSFRKSSIEQNEVVEHRGESDTIELVSCGPPLPSLSLIIVNPETLLPCPPHEVGEIWVAGDSVGAGYWNNPKETGNVFGARLKNNDDGHRYLRTGDLGFILDGNLFIASRLKDLIVINGANHYPQDIELSVEKSHPKLRQAGSAAFTVDDETGSQLIIVAEVERNASGLSDEIRQAIRTCLSLEHSLSVERIYLVKAGSMNKTSSGKIQRIACKQAMFHKALKRI